MIQKQFYKAYSYFFLFTIYLLIIGIVNGEEFPPVPIKPDTPSPINFFIKGDRSVYHELNDSLTYSNIIGRVKDALQARGITVDFNNDEDQKIRIKIRVRASNSISSSKWFNFGINVENKMIEKFEPIDLEYKKTTDKIIICKESDIPSISKHGRWFFDIGIDSNTVQNKGAYFVFKHISALNRVRSNYEKLYVRLMVEIIQHEKGPIGFIETIDNSLFHLLDAEDTGQPFEYYGLNIDEDKRTEHQFKIKGPIKIRVYTRPEEEKKDIEYSIKLSENGLLLGEYKINKYSDQESSFIETDYFHFTVPKGEHFYTLSSDEKVYIRLKKYLVALNKK